MVDLDPVKERCIVPEPHKALHPVYYELCVIWLLKEIRSALFQTENLSVAVIVPGHYYNGNCFDKTIPVHLRKESVPVHYRHNDVEKNKRDIRTLIVKNIKCRLTILSFHGVIACRLQDLTENSAVKFVIINNQNCFLGHSIGSVFIFLSFAVTDFYALLY